MVSLALQNECLSFALSSTKEDFLSEYLTDKAVNISILEVETDEEIREALEALLDFRRDGIDASLTFETYFATKNWLVAEKRKKNA